MSLVWGAGQLVAGTVRRARRLVDCQFGDCRLVDISLGE